MSFTTISSLFDRFRDSNNISIIFRRNKSSIFFFLTKNLEIFLKQNKNSRWRFRQLKQNKHYE